MRNVLHLASLAIIAIACSDHPVSTDDSPIIGLTRVSSNDSATTTPVPGSSTPGTFHGFVRGQHSGPDSASSAPPLANVRVTAYPRLRLSTDTLGVGPAAASVLTDATGAFQMPTMAGGEYVVTLNPQAPDDLTYRGAWTVTTIYDHSNDHPWWVYLPRK